MKIAIATEGNQVFNHFGRCETFTICEVEGHTLKETQLVDTQGHTHGALPDFLANLGVQAVIVGGMGGGAVQKLAQKSITIYTGVRGTVEDAIQQYLRKELQPLDVTQALAESHHHDHHHDHDHHHGGHSCNRHH
jgi:predicted Fe-Mo cluster-binding NifX family protein